MMITAYNIKKANTEAAEAQNTVREIAPDATFVFEGADNLSIYFRVVGRSSHITNEHARDLQEKTRFELTAEHRGMIYKAEFKMDMYFSKEGD